MLEEQKQIRISGRPTLVGLLNYTSGVACCLALLRIGITLHSDFLGGLGFWGAILATGAAIGYFLTGRRGIASGVLVLVLLTVVISFFWQ